ncbi:MAG TPA: hypothetical protein VJB69_00135 [Candidatus Paceibacterota bacterium]
MTLWLLDFFGLANKVFAQFTDETPSTPPPSLSPAITNPLRAKSIVALLTALLDVIVQVGIPVIALAIVYSGFLFVKAQGNESQLSEAKQTLYWTVIGAAIVLGAFVISGVIQSTIVELEV